MPTETDVRSPHSLSVFVFWPVVVASLFFIIGFSSVGWEYASDGKLDAWIGLWSTCSSVAHKYNEQVWFTATRGMMTLALILLLCSLVCIFIYMFFNLANKSFLLKMFAALNFAAVVFMVIGFAIFGSNHLLSLNWSFAFCVIGACICVFAGIFSLVLLAR